MNAAQAFLETRRLDYTLQAHLVAAYVPRSACQDTSYMR